VSDMTVLTVRSDYHTRNCDMPMMLGCVTALTKTTKENGATICIPGSHRWGPDRCPYDHEAVPAELEPGSALIFVGNLYHAGGGNITKSVFQIHAAETH
jgi:ectoine hydroxylase-related dioxygenase (phytanoyl-CoA dioxygenase family)